MKKIIVMFLFLSFAKFSDSQILVNAQNVEAVTHTLDGTAGTDYVVPAGKMFVITNAVLSLNNYSLNLQIDGITVLHASAGVTNFTNINILVNPLQTLTKSGTGNCYINGYLITL